MARNNLFIHREEYVYLAGLTHDTVIIAWGAFFFKVNGDLDTGKWNIVDDDALNDMGTARSNLIGASSASYAPNGAAEVTITDESGNSRTELFNGANHAQFSGLKANTRYSYSVKINGKAWGGTQLRDWVIENGEGAMRLSGRDYKNEFHTFPDPEKASPPVAFIVLGDFGRGVRTPSEGETCQREIAEAIDKAVVTHDVRFMITTGDNIYHGKKQGSGGQDDDWFFTFFQPYRHVINRVPVFPCVGNHDDGETFGESSDDRTQLYDNLHIKNRFLKFISSGEASLDPGLFYRFRFGSDIEFISIDTSKKRLLFSERYFRHPNHQQFLEAAFPEGRDDSRMWRIPFFHHPPYCAGPNHSNKNSVIEHLLPKFKRSGVRAAFCGHEHNLQYALDEGISYFVTGGGGRFSSDAPGRFKEAKTQAWGGNNEGHFVLGKIDGAAMTLTPLGKLNESGELRSIGINLINAAVKIPFHVGMSATAATGM